MKKIKFAQIGFGPIGQQIVKFALERQNLELVAVVDLDKEKLGRDAGEILNTGKLGITVKENLEKVLKLDFDIAVISTLSSFKDVFSTVKQCVESSKNIISTCEEMLYPFVNDQQLAEELDEIAKKNNVTVLGTGINPGFLMDFLPIILTTPQKRTDKVIVKRHQDASKRRLPFQKKIGAGLSIEEFKRKVKEGTIRHVGFKESVHLIAKALSFEIDQYKETVNPVVADEEVKSEYITVKKGMVKGVHQTAIGFKNGEELIKLELKAFLGNPSEEDMVELYGEPDITSTIKGGVNGDIGTASVVINTMSNLIKSEAGLKSVIDIPPAHFWR